MRLPRCVCFVVLTLVGASRVGAQMEASPTPRPTPPAPPLLKAAPDFAAWAIVQYTIPGLGNQSADAVIQSVAAASKPECVTSVTKTGQIRHQVKKVKTGEQEEVWYEHSNRITTKTAWKLPLFEGEASGANQPQGPDFPEVSWIAVGNFVGTQAYQGAAYFVFETQVAQGDERRAREYGYKLKTMFNRAYVNADTRLPWLLQTGNIVRRYYYQAAPAVVLDVPGELQAMFDGYESKKTEMAKKPLAP